MQKLDTYKVLFSDINTLGVYGISLVKTPAIASHFIALSDEANKIELAEIDKERRILLGAVLIPDKPIFRKLDDKKFNIVFDAETICLASQQFLMNGYQKSSTIEHNHKAQLSGVSVVESWIKEDAEKDKSMLHGIDEPVGTWFISMRIDDDEIWKNYVKTGEISGFSIDGLFDLEQIQLNSNIINEPMASIKEITDAVKKGVAEGIAAYKAELGKVDSQDGEITFNFEGDTLEAEKTQVTMTGPEGELPVPDGSYDVTVGEVVNTLVIKDSIVQSITPKVEEEAKPDGDVELGADGKPTPAAEAARAKSVTETQTKETVFALSKIIGEQIEKGIAKIEASVDAKIDAAVPVALQLTKQKGETPKAWEDMSRLERRRASKKE